MSLRSKWIIRYICWYWFWAASYSFCTWCDWWYIRWGVKWTSSTAFSCCRRYILRISLWYIAILWVWRRSNASICWWYRWILRDRRYRWTWILRSWSYWYRLSWLCRRTSDRWFWCFRCFLFDNLIRLMTEAYNERETERYIYFSIIFKFGIWIPSADYDIRTVSFDTNQLVSMLTILSVPDRCHKCWFISIVYSCGTWLISSCIDSTKTANIDTIFSDLIDDILRIPIDTDKLGDLSWIDIFERYAIDGCILEIISNSISIGYDSINITSIFITSFLDTHDWTIIYAVEVTSELFSFSSISINHFYCTRRIGTMDDLVEYLSIQCFIKLFHIFCDSRIRNRIAIFKFFCCNAWRHQFCEFECSSTGTLHKIEPVFIENSLLNFSHLIILEKVWISHQKTIIWIIIDIWVGYFSELCLSYKADFLSSRSELYSCFSCVCIDIWIQRGESGVYAASISLTVALIEFGSLSDVFPDSDVCIIFYIFCARTKECIRSDIFWWRFGTL